MLTTSSENKAINLAASQFIAGGTLLGLVSHLAGGEEGAIGARELSSRGTILVSGRHGEGLATSLLPAQGKACLGVRLLQDDLVELFRPVATA